MIKLVKNRSYLTQAGKEVTILRDDMPGRKLGFPPYYGYFGNGFFQGYFQNGTSYSTDRQYDIVGELND